MKPRKNFSRVSIRRPASRRVFVKQGDVAEFSNGPALTYVNHNAPGGSRTRQPPLREGGARVRRPGRTALAARRSYSL